MAEMVDLKEEPEKIILVGVSIKGADDDKTEESLKELAVLAKTANAVTVGRIIQNREKIHPGTYIGKGKIEEVQRLIAETDADTVVCDDELSPAQHKNLEEELKIKVIDRTIMILDIFAAHAKSREGKLQVELAQLKYRATRLKGIGTSMSRLGGGIGTRGPGEKKLETDRRQIRERITNLRAELDQMIRTRELSRKQRNEKNFPVIAIAGYTNAGKSTLLNHLTNAGVYSKDQLFATLDPTTRSYELASGQKVLFTDTVGFIRKLPHHLVEAFRSTLEEAAYADIILHVVDASGEDIDTQMEVVYQTFERLKITGKPIITAFNKMDKVEEAFEGRDPKADYVVRLSVKQDQGIDELLKVIEQILKEQKRYMEKLLPFSQAGLLQRIRQGGQLLSEEYTENGIMVKAYLPEELAYLLED